MIICITILPSLLLGTLLGYGQDFSVINTDCCPSDPTLVPHFISLSLLIHSVVTRGVKLSGLSHRSLSVLDQCLDQ